MSATVAVDLHGACDGQPFAMLLLATLPGLVEGTKPVGQSRWLDKHDTALDLVRRLVGQVADADSRSSTGTTESVRAHQRARAPEGPRAGVRGGAQHI